MATATRGLRVKEGDQMPSVGLRATDGYLLNLRSYVGRQPSIVVFFGNPGLTDAARDRSSALLTTLRESAPRLASAGVGILAASTDSEASQKAYVEETELPFVLLSDERRSAAATLGIGDRPVAFAVSAGGTIVDVVEDPIPRGLVPRLLESIQPPG